MPNLYSYVYSGNLQFQPWKRIPSTVLLMKKKVKVQLQSVHKQQLAKLDQRAGSGIKNFNTAILEDDLEKVMRIGICRLRTGNSNGDWDFPSENRKNPNYTEVITDQPI